jgi:hypothetical protein
VIAHEAWQDDAVPSIEIPSAVHPQQLQQIEETREPPVRNLQENHTKTMRGDRHHSTVGNNTHTKPGMAPRRQQTVSVFLQSTKGGGHGGQGRNSKQPLSTDLLAIAQKGQTANKTLSSGSRALDQHPNHVRRDSGMQKLHEATSADKRHIHHAATSSVSKSSHQARVPGEHKKKAATGAFGAHCEFRKGLLAKIQPHKHPSSQPVQGQTHAQFPSPSSSSLYNKPGQQDKEAQLARVAKEEEDADAWIDFKVANYERNLAASVVARPTKPDIQATVFPTPKPVAPRQQLPPPRPLIPPHSDLPSTALRGQKHPTIVQTLQTQTKRKKEKQALAQHGLTAGDDEDDLPEERRKRDSLFGMEVRHKTFNPSATAVASSHQPPHHANDTPTHNAADSSDAKPSLAHGAPPSGSNNFPGIHPGSLPSSSGLDYVPDNDEKSDPTNPQPPEGPFALNSAAGVRAIENAMPPPPARAMVLPYETSTSSRTTTQMFMGKGNTKNSRRGKTAGLDQDSPAPFVKAKAASKPPLYITANDLRLYIWRQEKLTWVATRERWSKLPGADAYVNRSEDSLRARFRAVQKLIETDEVTQELCDEVLNGVEGAEEELNRIVTELEQQKQQAEPELQLETGGFKKITNGKNAAAIKQETGRQYQYQQQQQQQPVSLTYQQQSLALNLPPNPPLAIAGTHPASPLRPTAGGKFYDATTFQAYIEHVAEACEQDSASDSNADYNNSREVSPICDADTVQWEYFMQRRDFTADDLAALPEDPTASASEVQVEENSTEEIYNPSVLWKTYTKPFRALSDANAEAVRFVWTTPPGSPLTFSAAGEFNISSRPDAFGMLTVSLTSPMGLSQVRVGRRLLTYQDHVYPQREEKDGWIPRVFWCVIVLVRDNKKGLMQEDGESTISRNMMFSSLALANSNAIDEWLKLTLKIRSANLDQRKIEMETAKIKLLAKLERLGQGVDEDDDGTGERAKYFKEVLIEEPVEGEPGSGRKVEVFVQEVMLAGPRN